MSTIHEECGIFGMFSNKTEDLASMAYYGLYSLQHRGQESCGIVVNDDGVFTSYKNAGLVGDVFNKENLKGIRPREHGFGTCKVWERRALIRF